MRVTSKVFEAVIIVIDKNWRPDLEIEITALNGEAARPLMDQGLPLPRRLILNLASLNLETLTFLEDTGQIERS